MNSYIKFSLLALVLSACGADGGTNDGDVVQLGQDKEAIVAPKTTNYVMGTVNNQAGARCTTISTGQVCNVPTVRTFIYCPVGLNAEELLQLSSVEHAASSDNHFSWTALLDSTGQPVRDSACSAQFIAHASNLNVKIDHIDNHCATAVAPATNIDSVVCTDPTVVTSTLTESPSVPGSFFGINGGVIHIDRARLLAKFPNAIDRSRVLQHGLGHAALALEGLGARTEPGLQFCYSYRPTFPISTLGLTNSDGEDCTLRFYSAGVTTQYNQDATHCVGVGIE